MSDKSKSSLLNESIIDATELKRTALKNAEQILLKNYAPIIEEQINNLIENIDEDNKELLLGQSEPKIGMQEPPDIQSEPNNMEMDIGADSPFGDEQQMGMPGQGGEGTDIKPSESTKNTLEQIPLASQKDGNSRIVINLGAATKLPKEEGEDMTDQNALDPNLQNDDEELSEPIGNFGENDEELDLDLQEIQNALEEGIDLDIPDDAHDGSSYPTEMKTDSAHREEELREKLNKDLINKDECGSGRVEKIGDKNSEQENVVIQEAVQIALKESIKYFDRKYKNLLSENKVLLKEKTIYIRKLNEMKEVLEKSNLLNTRLYYKNKVLQDPSLNERQKEQIVETISKAEDREKVKSIYDLRKSFRGNISTGNKKDMSLEKLLESKNYLSTFKNGNDERKNVINENSVNRMQFLAGIKKEED